MEHLPAELKVLILHAIEDFCTLYNLIRSSRSMYNAFKGEKFSILASTLRNSLPPGAIGEALKADMSSSLNMYTGGDEWVLTGRMFTDNLWPLGTVCTRYYPSPGTELFNTVARLHSNVEWLANDLCEKFAGTRRSLGFATLPLCLEEKVRIYRAFYRLQLLCNLFSVNPRNLEWRNTRDRFLDSQPLWEVEELACIYEYLLQELQSKINMPRDRPVFGRLEGSRPVYAKDLCIAQGMAVVQTVLSRGNIEDHGGISSSRKPPLLGITQIWIYIWERNTRLLSTAETAAARANGYTGPSDGWLLAYFRLAECDVLGDIQSWVPNRWSWGYCLWSSARLASMPPFRKLKAEARDEDWKASTHAINEGRSVPQEWADIINGITLF